jgi:hypothetical protein
MLRDGPATNGGNPVTKQRRFGLAAFMFVGTITFLNIAVTGVGVHFGIFAPSLYDLIALPFAFLCYYIGWRLVNAPDAKDADEDDEERDPADSWKSADYKPPWTE